MYIVLITLSYESYHVKKHVVNAVLKDATTVRHTPGCDFASGAKTAHPFTPVTAFQGGGNRGAYTGVQVFIQSLKTFSISMIIDMNEH